jgi:hypothetical protein
MITFLWMLYLAFTLVMTRWMISNLIKAIILKQSENKLADIIIVIVSLLWSIWYFYYLN